MELFGFNITKSKNDIAKLKIIDVENDYSEDIINSGGRFVQNLINDIPLTDINRIITYRQLAKMPEVSKAIDEIVGDAITSVSEANTAPVSINLDKIEGYSETIKKKIIDEFDNIIKLLNYNKFFPKYFKQWYIDGRIAYQIVIDDKNPKAGIQKIINLESTRIKKIRIISKTKGNIVNPDMVSDIEEYYVYFPKETWDSYTDISKSLPNINMNKVVKLNTNSVTFVPSGEVDENGDIISYLHKAIRPSNHLVMIEDSMIIYRMTRAPERRAFYIDVGQLPKQKAEQYISNLMQKYRNKISYDSTTGKVDNGKTNLSMLEDFWLPRRDGKGTEIDTLSGGDSNIMDVDSLLYFKNKLYESLNVPVTRLQSETIFNVGRTAEITRDEVKFSKFIDSIRDFFAYSLFNDILKKQLLLKKIINEYDWNNISADIGYKYLEDSSFAELREFEVMKSRFEILKDANEYITYFSKQYISKNILKQTDEEIKELSQQRENEAAVEPKEETTEQGDDTNEE